MPSEQRDYCTFFNRYYLYQGLALYKSLARYSDNFTFYVVCLDEATRNLLRKINFDNLILIDIAEIEKEELLNRKEKANSWQYYGLIQPFVCEYILDTFRPASLTYVDADIMFFGNPEILFTELDGKYASLVPHRFSRKHDRSLIMGKYCVQFNTFFNDEHSKEIIQYWKKDCKEYSKDKPHSYPGQKSLDNWTREFEFVREISNIGAGVAPWNIEDYEIDSVDDRIYVNKQPLVFYHFHQFGWNKDGSYHFCSYKLPQKAIDLIYTQYIRAISDAEKVVHEIDPGFNFRKTVKVNYFKNIMLTLIPNWLFLLILKIKHRLAYI